ncbi:IclR family transcriptional regulator [Streptomyces sp. NBC_00388]|uniref:IclR family transcriptional regulator n=1 Tax=Streptomyces sp. NBC_00388 TaxID=2975735 RepID=UPI002E1B0A0B
MVQSVQRAVRILRELMGAELRLGVTQLSERIGVAKPTVHALLRTLESESLVVQDAESGKYQLGPALVTLGNAYLDTHELRTRAATWANLLVTRTGEAVWVGVLVEEEVLVVHHAFRPESIVQVLETGATLPWGASALGKAIAAFSPAERRRQLLKGPLVALTGRTVTDPAELAAQLDEVRNTGYAVEAQELTLGDAGIAAPVIDRTGVAVGAVGLVGPVERLLCDERRQDFAIATRETARNLSSELGAFRGGGRPAML